jgi:hypothetical protein
MANKKEEKNKLMNQPTLPRPIGKENILKAMQNLPEDATIEHAIYKLYVLKKINKALAEDKEQAIPHEEVMQALKERIADKV